MREELIINEETAGIQGADDYACIKEAVQKLSNASEDQFESIKKEKWYNHVFDMVTFSQKGKKRLAEQIGTLAQAQQVLIELLLRLSENDNQISQIVADSLEDIRRIQEQNIYLLSRIKKLEDFSLGIKPDNDIRQLSDNDKRVLSACLYDLSQKEDSPSEAQQKYANNVLSFIGTDIQMENPWSVIEKLNEDSRRRILSCCMEYIFLKDCSEDSFDDYEDYIDEFDFGNKTIKLLQGQISSFYKLRGAEGFISKYVSENYEAIEDFFSIELDDEIQEGDTEIIERSDEMISSILQIPKGETKVFSNKNIHISAFINCEGEIIFDNCIVNYNESKESDEITLNKGANLKLVNSTVMCMGGDPRYFIQCQGNNNVLINNCTFVDCSYFLSSTEGIDFLMSESSLVNCYEGFLNCSSWQRCEIVGNTISIDKIRDFNRNIEFEGTSGLWRASCMFKLSQYSDDEDVVFENNTIKQLEGYEDKDYFSLIEGTPKVIKCTFLNTTIDTHGKYFSECRFENCSRCIEGDKTWSDKNVLVDKCDFVRCRYAIKSREPILIRNCTFRECNGTIIEGSVSIEFCNFIDNEYVVDKQSIFSVDNPSLILFVKEDYSNEQCHLKKCRFENCKVTDAYIVAPKVYSKTKKKFGFIADCDFVNCISNKGLFYFDSNYFTLFTDKEKISKDLIDVRNCRGV